jgi:hypothetical protein
MNRELIDEIGHFLGEGVAPRGDGGVGCLRAFDRTGFPAQALDEFQVVIAWNEERFASQDGVSNRSRHVSGFRTSIDEVSDEDEAASARRMNSSEFGSVRVDGFFDGSAERFDELQELVVTSVGISDHVEGSCSLGEIAAQSFEDDLDFVDAFLIEFVLGSDSLPVEASESFGHGRLSHDGADRHSADLGPSPELVIGNAKVDGDDAGVVFPGEGDERRPILGSKVGGVDDDEFPAREPRSDDCCENGPGFCVSRLVEGVVSDHGSARV